MGIITLDDAIDLLKSKKSEIVFIQVWVCDGELADPLRRHIVAGKMKGVIVEPVKYYFDKLQKLYANSTEYKLNCGSIAPMASAKYTLLIDLRLSEACCIRILQALAHL